MTNSENVLAEAVAKVNNNSVINRRTRNASIDILKFLAAMLITNSHMAQLYPSSLAQLATGGAMGDSLFFFCSGFTLLYSTDGVFFNWYKRRINRIFPAIFAIAFFKIVLFGESPTLKDTVLNAGGWFVQCIFVFYAFFWFVKRYFISKLWWAFVINSIIVLIWYFFYWDNSLFILANATYLRWPIFFFTMLLGASLAKYCKSVSISKDNRTLVFFVVSLSLLIGFYYGYQLIEPRFPILYSIQVILVPALLGITYCFFRICNTNLVSRIYSVKYVHYPIYWISALCLEIYYCQRWLFGIGEDLNCFFPFNVLITYCLIVIVAYIVKIVGNFISQTFRSEDYNFKKMISL